MKLFLFLAALPIFAQNPLCPGATGTPAHCVIISWPASTGRTPTNYKVYRTTSTGVCRWSDSSNSGPITPPSGCVPVGAVTASVLTLTDNSSSTNILTEGVTYFYVITSADATGESASSSETSAKIPPMPLVAPTPTSVSH